MFNYVVTIHNKENLLARTLGGIAACCSKQSKVIPVLDGCTDRSESIVDDFTATTGLNVEKVITPDVYELRALNAGMSRVTNGYVMCVQDDVILQEPELERRISALYAENGATLGVISLRHGASVRRTPLLRQFRQSSFVALVDEFERVSGPTDVLAMGDKVEYGRLVYRMVAGGSPFIIPELVWRTIGFLDEAMAPLMWFDHEYSIRALRAGFQNAVFPLKFRSDMDWSTMRTKAKDAAWAGKIKSWALSNRRYIWKKHGPFITDYLRQQGKSSWVQDMK